MHRNCVPPEQPPAQYSDPRRMVEPDLQPHSVVGETAVHDYDFAPQVGQELLSDAPQMPLSERNAVPRGDLNGDEDDLESLLGETHALLESESGNFQVHHHFGGPTSAARDAEILEELERDLAALIGASTEEFARDGGSHSLDAIEREIVALINNTHR